MKNRLKFGFSLVFGLPFLGLVLNLAKWGSGCFHALDLGIYQQAILDLAFTSSWNPLNTVRGIPIFADHFDPIILLAAALQRVIGPHAWFPIVFEFLVYYLGGVIAFLLMKDRVLGVRLALTSLWFFCTGMAVAFRYPVHPTTWSALPILMLAHSLKSRKQGSVFFWLNFLCLFKEYFPICFASYAVYLLMTRRFRVAALGFVNGGLWLWVDFVLRPRLFSDFHGHGNDLLRELLEHPFSKIASSFLAFDWKGSVASLLPFLVLLPYVARHEKDREWWLALGAYMLPVFGIQFLFGNIGFQYGAPVSAFFLSLVLLGDFNWKSSVQLLVLWSRRILLFSVVWLTGDFVNKTLEFFSPKVNHCRYQGTKMYEVLEVGKIVSAVHSESAILASGGLVPVVIGPNRKVYQYGIWSKIQESYDFLVLGRNNTSDLYPFGAEYYEKVIASCRPLASEVLMDTKNVFLARGRFTEECLHQRHPF